MAAYTPTHDVQSAEKPAEAHGAFHAHLTGSSRILMTMALALGTFMQVLDSTIANVAIPTIAGNLGVSMSQGTWVITSYAVANAIALPISGWLANRIGQVRLFLWSTALFVLASFLCGIAPNLASLVLFRVLQGAVAGPMMPLAQSLLLTNSPPEHRNMALALWATTVAVAPIFGPILGGYISDNYYWGWIFFINVPLGAIVVFCVWKVLHKRETVLSIKPMDSIGLALLVLGVGAFQLLLDRGKELDWFNSPEIITYAVVAVVGIVFLVVWELTEKHPVVDLSLFASRNFSIGVLCISLGMMIYLGTVVLMPLLLQTHYGYTATLSGLATAPIGFLTVLLVPFIGKTTGKVDLRWYISVSFIVFAYCMYMRTQFFPGTDLRQILIPQILQGVAIAFFFVPITTLAFANLLPSQMANAASLFNFIRTLFGAIGASTVTTLWERREAIHHTHLTAHITPYNPLAVDTMNTLQELGMTYQQSGEYLARQITKQGFILGATEIYWLATVALLSMVVLVWCAQNTLRTARPPRHAPPSTRHTSGSQATGQPSNLAK